ncbi:MAG: peptidase M64, partial [Alistipes sp.]|nr:peptidase M64 [Alistipes sp.]
MRRLFLTFAAILLSTSLFAQDKHFEELFEDGTLRIDYTFMGNATEQYVALRDMSYTDNWYGRRINLNNVPLKGNGDLTLTDSITGEVIYKTSFSSLFQEWITTPEALEISKSFEFTLLVPMPLKKSVATLVLRDNTGKESIHNFTIDPNDVLIRDRSKQAPIPHKYIHKGGDSKEAIDVVILAEGYTADQMDIFMDDAIATKKEILSYQPFSS